MEYFVSCVLLFLGVFLFAMPTVRIRPSEGMGVVLIKLIFISSGATLVLAQFI